jgi:hypothetical protein
MDGNGKLLRVFGQQHQHGREILRVRKYHLAIVAALFNWGQTPINGPQLIPINAINL